MEDWEWMSCLIMTQITLISHNWVHLWITWSWGLEFHSSLLRVTGLLCIPGDLPRISGTTGSTGNGHSYMGFLPRLMTLIPSHHGDLLPSPGDLPELCHHTTELSRAAGFFSHLLNAPSPSCISNNTLQKPNSTEKLPGIFRSTENSRFWSLSSCG